MLIALGADHQGYAKKEKLKEYLQKKGYQVIDCGTDSDESTDFPIYAEKVGKTILNNEKKVDFGIAICKTGIGMSIALNKIKGIMCAKICNKEEARLTKEHNHANALAISNSIDDLQLFEMIDEYINAKPLEDEKYIRRIDMIKEIEKNER